MDLVVQSPDELVAALPHVLGFKPEESIVLVPFTRGLPVARADLPRTDTEREKLLRNVLRPYGRNAHPGAMVAIVCVTEDRRNAELSSQRLSTAMERVGIQVPLRLWANDDRWVEFNSGQAGLRNEDTASKIAALTVAAGAKQPASSRQSLAVSMIGDRAPLAEALPRVRAQVEQKNTPSAELEWALGRIDQFHIDGNRLSHNDAARLLVAVEHIPTRNAVWNDISRDNTSSNIALWTDLTRRAPDVVRTQAASMLAFSSWLGGDGARAWCALDQVPPGGQRYAMAALVATAVQEGLPPSEWEANSQEMRAFASALDETFVPSPSGHRLHRDVPPNPGGPNRGTPSR
ncbi:DUF4192 domain-containing protein [Nocardioides immobilis]|uniref:DUF4192 domain-containing protein n=1 Tax=Nocardioides immobilis TaxID=2049295 RepID=A0A417XT95_9ACTN|nr:DUF4192 domain-containing protein [Nocardioides immobilis]RHW23724.1 DUF4192 domain-containing protein [Nocardioides immobilis]